MTPLTPQAVDAYRELTGWRGDEPPDEARLRTHVYFYGVVLTWAPYGREYVRVVHDSVPVVERASEFLVPVWACVVADAVWQRAGGGVALADLVVPWCVAGDDPVRRALAVLAVLSMRTISAATATDAVRDLVRGAR